MIPTIIFLVLLSLALLFFFLREFTLSDDFEILGGITGMMAIPFAFIMMLSLAFGYERGSSSDKLKIEARLKAGDAFALVEASNYNEKLKTVDNYWFRFTPRDPYEYIDYGELYREACN